MSNPARLAAIFAPALLALALGAGAQDKQVIWKLVDKAGKISYADKAPPKDYPGKVTRIEVDLKANIATLVTVGESSGSEVRKLSEPELVRVKTEAELARAIARLDEAKRARKEGEEPLPEEVEFIGKKGGGARPVPTQAYHDRIKALDEGVKAAQAEYERARKAARMAAID
jgi:hypothetical protein